MRVQDVMTKAPKTVAPELSAEEAWSLMRLNGIHHLVVTHGSRVLGVLSDRDAGGARGAALRKGKTVAELMSSPAVIVEPATTIRRAANVMRGRSIGCVVVVASGRAVGIVTVSDLLELVGRGLDRNAATPARRPLHHRVPHRKSRGQVAAW